MVKLRVGLFVAALSFVSSAARAQDTSEATATALFDEGMRLMEQGNYADACPKLARSHKLSPTGGTVLNLGDCYEKNGQFASAWAAFRQAAARAADAGKKDFEAMATERARKVESKVSRVTVKVGKTPEGIEVKRDGESVSRAEWGVAALVDAGAHRYEVTAPGHKRWVGSVSVAPGDAKVLAVPDLERESPPAAAPRKREEEPRPKETPIETSDGSTQRAIGLGVIGVGVVGIAIGSIFGLKAMNKNDDAKSHCRTSTLCDAQGVALGQESHDAALLSTVAFSIGGGAAVIGAVLVASAGGRSHDHAGRGSLRIGVGPTGASLGGDW